MSVYSISLFLHIVGTLALLAGRTALFLGIVFVMSTKPSAAGALA